MTPEQQAQHDYIQNYSVGILKDALAGFQLKDRGALIIEPPFNEQANVFYVPIADIPPDDWQQLYTFVRDYNPETHLVIGMKDTELRCRPYLLRYTIERVDE